MGRTLETTVDSEIAKYYLEVYLQNRRTNPSFDKKIDQMYFLYPHTPGREELKKISDSCSVDFAALFFAERLWQEQANRDLQSFFEQKVIERKLAIQNKEKQTIPGDSNYLVLFVPGWDYKENGHKTGADFAVPIKLITDLGVENHLAQINPVGSVEEDAEFLTKEIIHFGEKGKKIILVGASSAGPSIHLMLGKYLSEKETKNIKAWVNLGGILQGSPLLDYLQQWPECWFFKAAVWYNGWSEEKVLTMSAEASRQRFHELTLPQNIFVVNYMGLSLSGQISKYSQDKYPILREMGPNDGLTLLADIIAPRSQTIVALGSDHFFAEDPDINIKTIALAQTIIHYLETSEAK